MRKSAVLKEGLRLSAVVTTRLPRSAPEEALQYEKWTIPPRVCLPKIYVSSIPSHNPLA